MGQIINKLLKQIQCLGGMMCWYLIMMYQCIMNEIIKNNIIKFGKIASGYKNKMIDSELKTIYSSKNHKTINNKIN
jgi:hypothetical protein